MPKTAREAIRVVERDGWFHVRTKGSHRQFHHPTKPGTVTIPGPLGKELQDWLWKSILRQADLR
ncbi:MAG: type II toxin-antitoxin system HicA family toxin [Acidimicrobiaceae bacterium]|nr:type II toxin-antitoxin system HicA family toxin [Acidimicrobiaceae bacterium]